MKLPVFEAVGESLSYVVVNFPRVLQILWLPLLILTVANIAFSSFFYEDSIGLAMSAETVPEVTDSLSLSAVIGSMLLSCVVAGVLFAMMARGLWRHIVLGEAPSMPFYFRFGADEMRIIGGFILACLLAYAAMLVPMLVVGLAAMVASVISEIMMVIIMAIGMIASLVVMYWVTMRLSLFGPATVATHRIGLGESWRVTKGAVWSLFFFYLLIGVAFIAFHVVAILVLMPGYFDFLFAMAAAEPGTEVAYDLLLAGVPTSLDDFKEVGAWIYTAKAFVIGLIFFPLMIAPAGVAYRRLRGAA